MKYEILDVSLCFPCITQEYVYKVKVRLDNGKVISFKTEDFGLKPSNKELLEGIDRGIDSAVDDYNDLIGLKR